MLLRNFAVALLVVLGCALALIGQEAKPKAVKYALIVGVDYYEDSKRLDALKYAEADAKALAEVLKNGFQVTMLVGENGTKAKIEAAFQEILKKGTGADTLLVAFSGHGVQFKPDGGTEVEPFLCTRDCKQLDSVTQVSFNQMLSDAGAAKMGKALFLIDACRVDPNPNKSGIDGNAVKVKAQTVALFATSNGRKALEHGDAGGKGNGHGLFMSEVLAALGGEAKNKRGTVTWNGLVNHIAAEVNLKSKALFPDLREDDHQTPHAIGSLVGDAVLMEVALEVAGRKGDDEVSFEIADGVKMTFCWIPKGKSTLGSPATEKDRSDDEKEHEFATDGFLVGEDGMHAVSVGIGNG